MRVLIILCCALALTGCGRPSIARSQPAAKVMLAQVSPASAARLSVRSAAIGPDGRIAAANSAYGANQSLPVHWTTLPGAKTYAVVLEDPDAPNPDAPGPAPFVHWLVWNIPASVSQLAEGAKTLAPAAEGRNGAGGDGYYGPHPPAGTHHYHLQVFALDRTLALPAGADRDAVAAAMRGHVIASGEVIGLSSPPGA